MRRRSSGWRRLLLVAAAVLLGSACKLQLDVNVEVARDGSGSIEVVAGLDPDALHKIGGDLTAVMDVNALVDAGWVIDGPTKDSDGFTRVRIRHPFDTPADAAKVFAQIAGKHGPFQAFRVGRHQSFTDTRWTFTGKVDFTRGLAGVDTRALAAQIDGEPLGQSVEQIEAQLGGSLSRLIQVRVRARLPGEVRSNATTKADNGAVWQVGFAGGSVDLAATGHERRTSSLLLIAGAALLTLVLLLALLVQVAARVTAGGGRGL